jgi:hypothetical protein
MQQSQVSTVLYEQSQLESTTTQIMDLILDLLVIKRNKYNDRKRNRPQMIMSDQTILKYLQKRLFVTNNTVFLMAKLILNHKHGKLNLMTKRKKLLNM